MARKKVKKKKSSNWKKLVQKNSNKIIFVLLIAVIAWLWTSKEAPNVAVNETESGPVRPLDNELRFGWSYKEDYSAHNFVCRTCCCDKSRLDHVYVSYGDVEFDLRGVSNRTNIVTVTVDRLNDKCRRNDVFINGILVGDLNKETDGPMKTDFRFNVTPSSDVIHVKVEMIGDEKKCWWGNDLSKARVDVN